MSSLLEDARALLREARRSRQRRMLRLCGTADWLRGTTEHLVFDLKDELAFATLSGRHLIHLGKREPAKHDLGCEIAGLIVSTLEPLDPDALGACFGMVSGGGLVLFLSHDAEDPPSLFERHLARALEHASGTITHRESGVRKEMRVAEVFAPRHELLNLPHGARTSDQAHAVSELLSLLRPSAAPVVLAAHRGRGKSSALGLFAAEAFRRNSKLSIALASANEHASQVVLARIPIEHRAGLQIVEPAAAANGLVNADITLVDEASALSVPILRGILAHARRVAFATTIHGYEGSGQGFRARFQPELVQAYPKAREVWLTEPIRWQGECPIEAFTNHALLLDTGDSAPTSQEAMPNAEVVIERLERAALEADEPLLRAVFGLFVVAHYRTTPSDLAHLLDDEGVCLWVARVHQEVVGALWAVKEGGFSEEDGRRITRGLLRPQGHMLPEALARHLGEPSAAGLKGLRVVRIAVSSAYRRQGTATKLLRAMNAFGRECALDYAGSGFAVTRDVIAFWQANQAQVVHVGTKRGRASGEVSAVVLNGLTSATQTLVARLAARCLHDFPNLLRDGLRDLDAEVALLVLASNGRGAELLGEDEVRVRAYAFDSRPYDAVVSSLHRFVWMRASANDLALGSQERALLVAKILQGRPWAEIVRTFRFASVGEAMRAVRQAIVRLLHP